MNSSIEISLPSSAHWLMDTTEIPCNLFRLDIAGTFGEEKQDKTTLPPHHRILASEKTALPPQDFSFKKTYFFKFFSCVFVERFSL